MSLPIILGLVVLGLVLYLVSVYNQFQTLKTRIKASIQEIGNQLKRQTDLIPNLEASVKGYLKHETTIFDKLTEARKQVSAAIKSGVTQKLVEAASAVSSFLPALRIVIEDNPQLKAAATVTQLMDELRDTADKVMYSRRTLIDLTADFNQMTVTFPTNLVARLFNFTQQPGLTTPETGDHLTVKHEEMSTPRVSL
ncbi:MAG: LemA family protein [Candidatus Chisholmbacteria bacterium]|nr:LemA family protein [Candidatus Chisholmbacteria bacterium]